MLEATVPADTAPPLPDRIDVLEAVEEVQAGYLRIVRSDPLAQQAMAADEWQEILEVVLRLTASDFGFIGAILDDPDIGLPYLQNYAVSNIAWDDETRRTYGLQFKNLDTLFSAAITSQSVVISNDPETDPRAGGTPAGHPHLESFLGVPLNDRDGMVGMFGVANRPGGYDERLVEAIGPLTRAIANLVSTRSATNERIEIEREQQLKSLLIKTIVEEAGQGIIAFDREGIVQIANPAAEQIVDRAPGTLVGERVQDCIGVSGHRRATTVAWMKKVVPQLEAGKHSVSREVYALRKRGARIPIHVSFHRVTHGAETLFVAVFGDLTGMALELARVKHDAERLIETANAPIFAVDKTGRISEWNDKVSRITGFPRNEALGRPFVDSMVLESEKDRVAGVLSAALLGEDVSDYAATIQTKDGCLIRLLLSTTARTDDHGRVIGTICVGQDISERLRAEEHRNSLLQERARLIRRLHRMSEDQQRSVVYDLHDGPAQLLAGANMLLQDYLARPGDSVKRPRETLSAVQGHVQAALVGVQRIMAVLRPADLDDLGTAMALKELCEDSSRRTNATVRFYNEIARDCPIDESTEIVVYRIAQEAVNNALRHSGASQIDVRLWCEEGILTLEVADQGVGFDSPSLPADRRRYGMGLAGMRERAEMIDARFAIRSAPGEGTAVTLSIPLTAVAPPECANHLGQAPNEAESQDPS
ncbi:MAG: PAS domain S-box protein [Chloroflexi bacterium]|nr:PAS domain S-box protein [Chloroflexota bacterium]